MAITLLETLDKKSDNFDDNYLDLRHWRKNEYAGATANEQNGRLEFTTTTAANSYSQVISTYSPPDDFDVSVDFNLVTWPAPTATETEYTFKLSLETDDPTTSYGFIERNNTQAAGDLYVAAIKIAGVEYSKAVATTVLTGKFRILKTGKTITTYNWDGVNWSKFFSKDGFVAPIKIILLQIHNINSGLAIAANFDNYFFHTVKKHTTPLATTGFDDNIKTNHQRAQQYEALTPELHKLRFWVKKNAVATPTDHLYLKIFNADEEGKPTGTSLWSGTALAAGTVTTDYVNYELDIGLATTIGNKYVCVFSSPGCTDASLWLIRATRLAAEMHDGRMLLSTDEGSTWNVLTWAPASLSVEIIERDETAWDSTEFFTFKTLPETADRKVGINSLKFIAKEELTLGNPAVDTTLNSLSGITFIERRNAARTNGQITRFSVYVAGAGSIRLKVFRESTDQASWNYVGESGLYNVSAGLNSFSLPTPISVERGDYIGFYITGTTVDLTTGTYERGAYQTGDIITNTPKTAWTNTADYASIQANLKVILNEYIDFMYDNVHTLSYKDIKDRCCIAFWLKSSRVGKYLQFQIAETDVSGVPTLKYDIYVHKSNVWQEVFWAIDAIPKADRDAIYYLALKCIDNEVGFTGFLDHIEARDSFPQWGIPIA